MHKLPTVRDPESAIKGRETYQAAVEHRRRDQADYRSYIREKCDAGGAGRRSGKSRGKSEVKLAAGLERTLDPLPHGLEAQLGIPLEQFAAAARTQ